MKKSRFRTIFIVCLVLVVLCFLLWMRFGEKTGIDLEKLVKFGTDREQLYIRPPTIAGEKSMAEETGKSRVKEYIKSLFFNSQNGTAKPVRAASTSLPTENRIVFQALNATAARPTMSSINVGHEIENARKNALTTTVLPTPTPNLRDIPLPFRPILKKEDKEKMVDLLSIFDQDARQLNITYFLLGGSLLGLYRHGGFVPWDDDLDIIMDAKDAKRVFAKLAKHNGYRTWTQWIMRQWKFYPENGHELWTEWMWPYLDVFFYTRNDTHIQFGPEIWNLAFRNEDIFPVRRAKFESIYSNVPRKITKFLSIYFRTDNVFEKCVSNYYDHSKEANIPESMHMSLPCDRLRPYYHFEDRQKNPV